MYKENRINSYDTILTKTIHRIKLEIQKLKRNNRYITKIIKELSTEITSQTTKLIT